MTTINTNRGERISPNSFSKLKKKLFVLFGVLVIYKSLFENYLHIEDQRKSA